MEAPLSFCFIALSTLLAICFLKFSVSLGKSKHAKKLWPPGPWTLPIIGSLHHLMSPLPHRRFRELSRRHGPLMFLKLGEVPLVVVSSVAVAEMVLKTNDPQFASRPSSVTVAIGFNESRGIICSPYGDMWRQRRNICVVELLSSRQVKRMEGIRAEEMGNLLRSVRASSSAGGTISGRDMVAAVTNDLTARVVFGGKFTYQHEYLHELEKILDLVGGFPIVDLFPSSRLLRWLSNTERRLKRSSHRIRRIFADILHDRKVVRATSACSTDNEGLLDALLKQQEQDSLTFPLTMENIGAILFDILGGATYTIITFLEWAISELVNHPEAMSKAQLEIRKVLGKDRAVISNGDLAELNYLPLVIKEVLRLHPPGPLLHRIARGDCKIMGYDIPEGTIVCINILASSTDPKYWKNPEEFYPERFENNNVNYNGTHFQFTPFGSGQRQCPGIQFTTSIMEIVLANLLYHFDWMFPEGDSMSSNDMSEKFGLAVRRKYDLKLRAVPYECFNAIPSK